MQIVDLKKLDVGELFVPLFRQIIRIALVSACLAVAVGCSSKASTPSKAASLPSSKAADIGFVLEIKGQWFVEGQQKASIKAGDNLPAGGTVLHAGSPTDESMLLVSLCTGELLTITKERHELPKRVDPERISRVWSLASKHVHSELVSAQSRGGENALNLLHEGLVRLQNGDLGLATIFEEMPIGLYRLRLEPIRGLTDSQSADPILLDAYDWSPSTTSALKFTASLHGAYELVAMLDKTSNPEMSAVIVIGSPEECNEIAADFEAAKELVSRWGVEATLSVRRRFLQATLATLADEQIVNKPSKK